MPCCTSFAMLLTWIHASPVLLLLLLLVMKGCMLRLPVPLKTVCCPMPGQHACRERDAGSRQASTWQAGQQQGLRHKTGVARERCCVGRVASDDKGRRLRRNEALQLPWTQMRLRC